MGPAYALFDELLAHQTSDQGWVSHRREVTCDWLALLTGDSERSVRRHLRRLAPYYVEVEVTGRGFRLRIAKPFRLRGTFEKVTESAHKSLRNGDRPKVADQIGQSWPGSEVINSADPQPQLMLGPVALNLRSGTTSFKTKPKSKAARCARAPLEDLEETPQQRRQRQLSAARQACARAETQGIDRKHILEAQRCLLAALEKHPWYRPTVVEASLDHCFERVRDGTLRSMWGYLHETLARRNREEVDDELDGKVRRPRQIAEARAPG